MTVLIPEGAERAVMGHPGLILPWFLRCVCGWFNMFQKVSYETF